MHRTYHHAALRPAPYADRLKDTPAKAARSNRVGLILFGSLAVLVLLMVLSATANSIIGLFR